MIPYTYLGDGVGLRPEVKTNWQQGQVGAGGAYFVHGGPMNPSDVMNSQGLTPMKAREYLTDHATQQPIAGGKMIFTFQVAGGALPANARKSGAVGRLWGFDGHCYVFFAPQGTVYWSTNGALAPGAEVAFPYIIELSDLVEYWAPSSTGTQFQKVAWNMVVAARTNNLALI